MVWDAAVAPVWDTEEAVPVQVYTTARGERATIMLADGSRVVLSVESRLEIPSGYGHHGRDVYLRGEGYFAVERHEQHPFRVHANGIVTEVLGTKFGVRARQGDTVRVVVADGQVALRDAEVANEHVVLSAGQMGYTTANGQVNVISEVDVADVLGWIHGRLSFDGAPLPEVLDELSRWYNRDFVLADSSLADIRLTTQLGGEALEETVKVLEVALEARVTVTDRAVILRKK